MKENPQIAQTSFKKYNFLGIAILVHSSVVISNDRAARMFQSLSEFRKREFDWFEERSSEMTPHRCLSDVTVDNKENIGF